MTSTKLIAIVIALSLCTIVAFLFKIYNVPWGCITCSQRNTNDKTEPKTKKSTHKVNKTTLQREEIGVVKDKNDEKQGSSINKKEAPVQVQLKQKNKLDRIIDKTNPSDPIKPNTRTDSATKKNKSTQLVSPVTTPPQSNTDKPKPRSPKNNKK